MSIYAENLYIYYILYMGRGTYAPLDAGLEVELVPHAHEGRLLRVDRQVQVRVLACGGIDAVELQSQARPCAVRVVCHHG